MVKGQHCGPLDDVIVDDGYVGAHIRKATPIGVKIITPLIGLTVIGTAWMGTSTVLADTVPVAPAGAVSSVQYFRGTAFAGQRDLLADGDTPSRSSVRESMSTKSTGNWGGIEQLDIQYSHSTDEKTALDDLRKNKDSAQSIYDSSYGKVSDDTVRTDLKQSIDKVDPLVNDPNSRLESMNGLNDELKRNMNIVTTSMSQRVQSTAGSYNQSHHGSPDLSTIKLPDGRSANDLVNYAMQYVGKVPYVWGGTTTSGWDCSGFVRYVYAQFGVSLPRVSGAQATVGRGIGSLADAKPGDIIANPQHAAIYIGNGMVVNALDPADGTTVTPIGWAFTGGYSIRRVIE